MPDLLTADGLRRFDAVAAAHVAEDKVPGLVALVAQGEQEHVDGARFADGRRCAGAA